jgi:toxin YoeB
VKLIFAEEGWDDYLYWQQQDKRVLKRINELIAAAMRAHSVGLVSLNL